MFPCFPHFPALSWLGSWTDCQSKVINWLFFEFGLEQFNIRLQSQEFTPLTPFKRLSESGWLYKTACWYSLHKYSWDTPKVNLSTTLTQRESKISCYKWHCDQGGKGIYLSSSKTVFYSRYSSFGWCSHSVSSTSTARRGGSWVATSFALGDNPLPSIQQ